MDGKRSKFDKWDEWLGLDNNDDNDVDADNEPRVREYADELEM